MRKLFKFISVVSRYGGLGTLGYMLPRFLEGLGVPLNDWSLKAGQFVRGDQTMIDHEMTMTILAIFFAVLFMFAELWLRPVGRLIGVLRENTKTEGQEAIEPVVIETDTPMYEVLDYIATRNWLKPIEEDSSPDVIMARLRPAMNDLRQKAFNGEIAIKGRDFGCSPSVEKKIPAEYWERNKLNFFKFFDSEEGVYVDFNTASSKKGKVASQHGSYNDMHVSKSLVMELWPPTGAQERSGGRRT